MRAASCCCACSHASADTCSLASNSASLLSANWPWILASSSEVIPCSRVSSRSPSTWLILCAACNAVSSAAKADVAFADLHGTHAATGVYIRCFQDLPPPPPPPPHTHTCPSMVCSHSTATTATTHTPASQYSPSTDLDSTRTAAFFCTAWCGHFIHCHSHAVGVTPM